MKKCDSDIVSNWGLTIYCGSKDGKCGSVDLSITNVDLSIENLDLNCGHRQIGFRKNVVSLKTVDLR